MVHTINCVRCCARPNRLASAYILFSVVSCKACQSSMYELLDLVTDTCNTDEDVGRNTGDCIKRCIFSHGYNLKRVY